MALSFRCLPVIRTFFASARYRLNCVRHESSCQTTSSGRLKQFERSTSSFSTKEQFKEQWYRNNNVLTGGIATALILGLGILKAQSEEKSRPLDIDSDDCQIDNAIEFTEDLLRRIQDEVGSPGLVISVSKEGNEVWAKGFGYADVEKRVPCTKDTVLRIASISKPITMAMVAKLMESGQLDIDKPVQEYVKSWPEKCYNNEKVNITTRQLLSHQGGIRHYDKNCGKKPKDKEDNKKAEENTKTEDNKDNEKEKKTASLVEKIPEVKQKEFHLKKRYKSVSDSLSLFKDDPLCFKPGTDFLYTTHGWTLISAVVESAGGKKFEEATKDLFRDLGMFNTYLDENDPIIYNRGSYYIRNKQGRLRNADHVDNSYKWAGGGFLSTVSDIVKFGQAMLYSFQYTKNTSCLCAQGGINKNCSSCAIPGYLQPETMQKLWNPVQATPKPRFLDEAYGMGWYVVPSRSRAGMDEEQRLHVAHTGGAMGASSVLLILPSKDDSKCKSNRPKGVVVAIIVNISGVGLEKAALAIAKEFEKIKL